MQAIQVSGYTRNPQFTAEKIVKTASLQQAPEVLAARKERITRQIDQDFADYLDAVLSATDFSEAPHGSA